MPRALIIEDNPAVMLLTRKMLEAESFEVDTASSGKEGRNKVDNAPPDLLVLDLGLPDDFGLDICKEVKKKHPTVLIFVLTALGDSQDVVQGLEAGADDYLPKPFNKREFMARVRLIMRRAPEKGVKA